MFLLFLLLEMVAIALTIRSNAFHGASWYTTSNAMVGWVSSVQGNVTDYFHLRTVNRQLAEENAMLRGMIVPSQYLIADSCDLIQKDDTLYRQQYDFMAAKVVRMTVNRQSNHMTIDRGRAQGIEPEMAVIASDGIVGIVKNVSEHYATVLPVLHRRSSISARLHGSGYFGALRWDGRDPMLLQLHEIPDHVQLYEGMTVETSGLSAMFPDGLPIGKVEHFDKVAGDNFHSIIVRLNTDLRTLRTVYVVKNLMRYEQKELEELESEDE